MFRCNQCPKKFEDHSSIRRHLSIKHFTYSPYLCNICIKTEQFHVTATEDDMNEHFETVHPGTKPSIILSRDKVIEDKLKAVVEECRLPASQISRNFKNNLHQDCNAPSDRSPFRATAIEIGPVTSHVTQEQTNGETTENVAEDDIEIVFESVQQKVKDEVTTPKPISLGLKDALRRTYDILCDETTVGTLAKEVECFSSEIKHELSNNEATGNITADKNDDYNRKMIVQRKSNAKLLENSSESHTKDLGPDSLAAESNSYVNAVPDESFNQINEEIIPQYSTPNGQSTAMRLPSVGENVFSNEQNTDEEFDEHDHIQTRQPSSSNKSAANLIHRKRTLPLNDRHSRTKILSERSNPKKTNATEKLHKCDHCSYASAQKSDLKRHMRTHTGEKPFKCGHCSYACNQKSSLNIHVRIHTGEKPYKCDVCPYASAQAGALREHMRTHTGEKPYKCSECAYAGIKSSNLQDHVRRHHYKETE